jgi:hypothetical protein
LSASLNAWGEVVGSGKLETPCERMQLANLTASCVSCCTWAWVGGPPEPDEPDELDEVEELEPQAASTIVAAIAAVTV